MISRQLVPRDIRLPAETAGPPARRLATLLDDRELVPSNMPRGTPLDTRTSIPLHLSLDVFASRVVVPRDMPTTPLDPASVRPDYAPLTILDHRITVPVALPQVTLEPKGLVAVQDLPTVLESDIFTTGEVNLMVEPVEHPPVDWNWTARTGSILVHGGLVLLILLQARLFPYRVPTQEQIDIARQQLHFIYMPPDVRGLPRTPPPAPRPQIRIDPRVIRQLDSLDTTVPQPVPGPKAPERVVPEAPPQPAPELPAAPKPQVPQRVPQLLSPQEARPLPPDRGLILPPMNSPGRALEESAQEALRGSGGSQQFGGAVPGGSGSVGGGGGGQGYLGGNVEMLTPTEGVDFTNYLARVVASVKRNWYSVMPESARLGDRGRVVLQFRIMRDGMVPDPEPSLMGTSGKEPLDRAAISSIRTSSPFPPLPAAFSGPYIELRFIFLYNLPLNYQ
jgi:TonB family protein